MIWDGTRYYVEPPDVCFQRPRRPPAGVDCRQFETLDAGDGRALPRRALASRGVSVWSFRRRDVPDARHSVELGRAQRRVGGRDHRPRTRRPQAAAPRGPQRRDPDRAQAGVDQDPREDGPGLHRAAEPREGRGPPHGVPGGRLPQHLRVLGGPRGDVPHRRRPVHPPLRLLPDRHRQAGAARPRRAAPGRRVGAEDAAALRHHHRRRPRRPARRRRLALRRDGARDPRAQPRHRRREPDPRLQRQARPPDGGLRVAARGARPQRRDGAADLQADPPGLPLRPLARRDHPGPRLRPGHQVQPDPRHGRDPRGGQPGAARPPRRRLRADHHHPVPPALGAPPPRRAVGEAGGVRRAQGRGRRDRFLRRHVGAAGPFVLPGRSVVPSGLGRTEPPAPPSHSLLQKAPGCPTSIRPT